MRPRALLSLVGLLIGAPTFVGAIAEQISDPDIRQAIAVAHRGDPLLSSVHAPYTLTLGDPTFDRVEVITEYRRVVMTAEEHLKLGELWDVTKAKPALAPYRGLVSFVLWIKFPPQNLTLPPQLAPLPNYELILYPKGIPPPPAKPEILKVGAVSQTLLFPAGGGNFLVGPTGSGMSGVRIEGSVPFASLEPRGRTIVGLLLDGKEQRQLVFNLASLR